MREILFKAKRKDNGEWVYGYLTERVNSIRNICKEKRAFIHGQKLIYSHNWPDKIVDYEYEVDPETVCQYTGMTDKNGKKIFEDDQLKVTYLDYVNGEKRVDHDIYHVSSYTNMNRLNYAEEIEVIGNIHDEED